MANAFDGDVLVGLSGIDLQGESYDLGEGISIRTTYAHLIGAFLVAFSPAESGQHHPPPCKSARTGIGIDIVAELHIPQATMGLSTNERLDLVQLIVALLRLWVTPTVTAPMLSNIPFASAKDVPDNEAYLWPYEFRGFEHPFQRDGGVEDGALDWVRDNWKRAFELTRSSTEFRAAVFALDQTQFMKDRTLVLISFWAAMEGLFLTNAQELRFRLASFVASYMENPGPPRIAMYKMILNLYDHRSKAAHGKPKNDPEALGKSFNLLRSVVLRIVDDNQIPSNEQLEARLLSDQNPQDS